MARAGKKCMFEDDVRQLLGMPQPVETRIMADTSLEKAYGHGNKSGVSRQMDDRGGMPEGGKEPVDGSALGRVLFASRRLIITVLLVGLLGLGIVVMVEELHQTSRRQLQISYKTKGHHPRRAAKLAAAPSPPAAHSLRAVSAHAEATDDDEVVSKENWRALQDKADRYRSLRQASASTGGMRAGHPHSSDPKALAAQLGSLAWPGSKAEQGASSAGGWADVHGGPHSGAKGDQGEFGAGIYSW